MKIYISITSLFGVPIALVLLPLYGSNFFSWLFWSLVPEESFFLDRHQLFLLFAFIVLILLTIFIFRDVKKHEQWELADNKLLRGHPVNLKLDLDKAEIAYWSYRGSAKYLVIKLDDKTFFSLDLFDMINGLKMMQMVEQVLGEKLSDDQQEISKRSKNLDDKLIRKNRLIKL